MIHGRQIEIEAIQHRFIFQFYCLRYMQKYFIHDGEHDRNIDKIPT